MNHWYQTLFNTQRHAWVITMENGIKRTRKLQFGTLFMVIGKRIYTFAINKPIKLNVLLVKCKHRARHE